ncbi:esterase/lipase family protein [Spirosoma flavum]|uniref:Esterase/lipase family protein n=1 Tax=Spirosoma flavum TaxID=2048557 RepID=A0ABW6AIT9_9BACT
MSFTPPFYPIIYVRGYAPTKTDREDTFHDLYYGYSDTSVESRPKAPNPDPKAPIDDRISLDLFEGQLIRFMKEFAYVDTSHGGLELAMQDAINIGRPLFNPTRSLWVSRFYDTDVVTGRVRPIIEHAKDLRTLIDQTLPEAFKACNIDASGPDFKVILVAHSMGGLVCRALIQNLYPESGVDPKSKIHRLVTMGSPHGGIEFGIVPDFLESFIVNTFNPGGANMFYDQQMRQYLKLDPDEPMNSLGNISKASKADKSFPVARCFCVIGSNHAAYNVLGGQQQRITGNFSDGLVKQDRAFIEGAFTANVHRAHSSRDQGIVNSYQSFENIQRFLFGDTKVAISLDELTIANPDSVGHKGYYNLEFRLAIRGAGAVFLHDRREDPCENAYRFTAEQAANPLSVFLHTAFLSSKKARPGDPTLNFLLSLRVAANQIKEGMLWDHEYPVRPIYSETLEIRVNTDKAKTFWEGGDLAADVVQYSWLSGVDDTTNNIAVNQNSLGKIWQNAPFTNDSFSIPLRKADSLSGVLRLIPTSWPDKAITQED